MVETKLWKSAESRRKVVAQIIDYAKELVHWDYGTLEEKYHRCADSAGASASTLYEYVCQQTGETPIKKRHACEQKKTPATIADGAGLERVA